MKSKFTPRQLTPEEEREIKERLDLLSKDGRKVEGTSNANDINTRPLYYDEAMLERARKSINKYYTGVSMSSTIGLMLLVQLEEILIPLLKTGKSRTVMDLYDRYTATAMYIKRCYETDFYDPKSDGWRYISIVRGMHQRTYKLLNSPDCSLITQRDPSKESDYVWVNQYDMALTQFAFIGFFILRPEKCGAHHITESELSHVVYYWRLLSYQLGIEDRFNLFVYNEDMSKQHRLLELILEEFKRKLTTPRVQTGLEMSRGFLLAFEDLASEATFNIIEHHWFDVISVSGNQQPDSYSGFGERWKLFRFKVIHKLMKNESALQWINTMYKKKLENFCKKGQKIKKKLAKKYPDCVYELPEQFISNSTNTS